MVHGIILFEREAVMNSQVLTGFRMRASQWLLLGAVLGLGACSEPVGVTADSPAPGQAAPAAATALMSRQSALEAPGT